MKETLDAASSRLTLHFDDAPALRAYVDKSRDFGLSVKLIERLEEKVEFTVVLTDPGREIEVPTRIRQIYRSGVDRWGTIFEVLDWSPVDEALTQTPGKSTGLVSPSGAIPIVEPERGAPPENAPPEKAGSDPKHPERAPGEIRGTAPVFAIRQMNPNQRMRLASTANRNERQVLLRDGSPQVLMNLLNNPQIENREIIELIKNPQCSAGILKRIAQDRRYTSNYEVQAALVRNPKTPTPVAVRLVEYLRLNDLRDMSKSQALRDDVRQAALRVYLRRSSKR